jgi:hypothetical protein
LKVTEPFFRENGFGEFYVKDSRDPRIPLALCSNESDADGIVYAMNKQHRLDDYDYVNSNELDELLSVIKQYKELPETVLVCAIETVYSNIIKKG